jgi:hypothetical protein
MAQYRFLAFYTAVALLADGRNYWPKHVAVNVMNKLICYCLWCYTHRENNQQALVKSLLFFVKAYFKFSVLFYWHFGSQSLRADFFMRNRQSPKESFSSHTQLITTLPSARQCPVLHSTHTVHTFMSESADTMLTHSGFG